MRIRYDVEKLNTIARDLFEVLHLSVVIIDRDGNRLVKCYDPHDFCSVMQSADDKIRMQCYNSDTALVNECRETGKICAHVCHMNLCDVALPIIKDGVQVAYIVLGRMRGEGYNEPRGVMDARSVALYNALPYFSERELSSLQSLLSIILFGGAITFDETDTLNSVISYVEENLSADLSIPAICKRFFISKNTLYKLFHDELGCTVGEFISRRRIDEAKTMLRKTDMSVERIARELGFESYAYFCRFFKSRTDMTPSIYRAKSVGK